MGDSALSSRAAACAGYLTALGSQAGEDFSGVVMLWTHRTPRVAVLALLNTFVLPWDSPVLAGVVLALAAAGVLSARVACRDRAASGAIARSRSTCCSGPVRRSFHLLFQETVTVRYALPLVLPVAYLAGSGRDRPAPRPAAWPHRRDRCWSRCSRRRCPPPSRTPRTPSPIFGALADMRRRRDSAPPVVGMHRRVSTESRRARLMGRATVRAALLPAPRDYEWLELTRAWRERDATQTWFVADPRRTDLALIDPREPRPRCRIAGRSTAPPTSAARARRDRLARSTSPDGSSSRAGRSRPRRPASPQRDGWGPHRRPSVGWVRRRAGRSADDDRRPPPRRAADPAASRPRHARRPAVADVRRHVRVSSSVRAVPAGRSRARASFAQLDGDRAARRVAAQVSAVAIEQFDLQPPDRSMLGFDAGGTSRNTTRRPAGRGAG